jgi:phosphoribosylformylglycinamidine cyclo-ligase
MQVTYKEAGVDVEAAERLIEKAKDMIASTFGPLVLNPIGGFASVLAIPSGLEEPVLVTSTDGVGTKLKIALISGRHKTVGIDLVAMCANDILTFGARPYFFLDYFACSRLKEDVYRDVIEGICEGCRRAGCALVGGETAEMPGFYGEGEYDLAGFIIGFVEKRRLVDGSKVKAGDLVLGLPSSGLHSNGFSLARKVLLDMRGLSLEDRLEGSEESLLETLLRPTRIYVDLVLGLASEVPIHGMAHVTGGGLPGNVKRVIPKGLAADIELHVEDIPSVFKAISSLGPVSMEEMLKTFNMGVGFVLIVDERDGQSVLKRLKEAGERVFLMGSIRPQWGKKVRITLVGGGEARTYEFD